MRNDLMKNLPQETMFQMAKLSMAEVMYKKLEDGEYKETLRREFEKFSPTATMILNLLRSNDTPKFELVNYTQDQYAMHNDESIIIGTLLKGTPRIFRIVAFETFSPFRGQGKGKELYVEFEKALKEMDVTAVVLTANNQFVKDIESEKVRLKEFYTKLGFCSLDDEYEYYDNEFFKAFKKVSIHSVHNKNLEYLSNSANRIKNLK